MFGVLILKEFRSLIRNRMLLLMVCMYPVVILLILPWATNMDINDLNTIIIDMDRSPLSKELQEKIYQSSYFKSVSVPHTTQEQTLEELRKGNVDVVITIPKDLEKELQRARHAEIQLSVNAINATKGALGIKYLNSLIQQFTSDKNPTASIHVGVYEKPLYNPTSNFKSFIIPGLISILITLIAFLFPALNLVEEKESGTIEQLNVSPLNPFTLILAKTIPFIAIDLLMLLVGIGIVYGVYSIYPIGGVLGLLCSTLVYAISLAGMGITLANYSKSQQQTMFSAVFILFFMLLMSGIFTPTSGMPNWAKQIAYWEPLTYYVRTIRTIYLKGGNLALHYKDILVLLFFALVFYSLSWISYKKRG